MSENDVAILLGSILLSGLVGGLIGGVAACWATLRLVHRLRLDVVQQQRIEFRARPVQIVAEVMPPAPVEIPVEIAPAPTLRDLGQRVLTELPEVGPRALARILNCSPSTAQAVIEETKKGAAA